MKRLMMLGAAALLVTLSSAGCANLHSIGRTLTSYAPAQVHYTDAKQWGVLSQQWAEYPFVDDQGKPTGKGYWIYRSCAQPSPDVFSVLGSSFSTNLAGQTDDETKKLTAQAALAIAEAGSTIQRTQTINALRESMYRTCERYMNGMTSKDESIVQAARDQRAMVAILAIEQLTGVVVGEPTIIMAGGSAVDADKPLEIMAKYEELTAAASKAANAKTAAATQQATAQKLWDDLNGKDEVCDKILETAAPEEESETDAAKRKQCQGARDTLKTAKDAKTAADDSAKKAQDAVDVFKAALDQGGSSGVQAGADGKAGSGIDPASPSDRAAVATVVQHIVDAAFSDTSEMVFVCMSVLRDARNSDSDLVKACTSLMINQAQSESAKAASVAKTFGASPIVEQRDKTVGWLETIEDRVLAGGKPNRNALERVLGDANRLCNGCFVNTDRNSQFVGAGSRADLAGIFRQFPGSQQSLLAEAAANPL